MQRRAAIAAADADSQLRQLMDDAAAAGSHGASALADVPGTTVVGGARGGLLDNLQPVGPPMSFSPGEFFEPVRGETTKGEKNLEVKGNENPEVKRVVVADPKESGSQRNDGADGNAPGSPQSGNGKGHGSHVATGKGNGGSQNVPRGSGNPRSAVVEPVHQSGMDRNVVGENPPQTWVTNVNVGRNEIQENVGHHGDEKHVVHGQGVEGSMPRGFENQVNPFWSPECKGDALQQAMNVFLLPFGPWVSVDP